jgi:SOS-response transcriptional repressor LexA
VLVATQNDKEIHIMKVIIHEKTNMETKNFQNVSGVIDRAKSVLGVSSDADFARVLGVLPSTITNWRSRNTINFPLIISKCSGVSLDWLINGFGEKMLSPYQMNKNSSIDKAEESRICFVEHQIKDLYNLFQEKIERNPLVDLLVEIPLYSDSIDTEKIDRYMVVSKECIRDRNTSSALRLQDKDMLIDGFELNDLLIIDTGLPIKDHCIAVVEMNGKQCLKQLFLREGDLFINDENKNPVKVTLLRDIKILAIVQKQVRELY